MNKRETSEADKAHAAMKEWLQRTMSALAREYTRRAAELQTRK